MNTKSQSITYRLSHSDAIVSVDLEHVIWQDDGRLTEQVAQQFINAALLDLGMIINPGVMEITVRLIESNAPQPWPIVVEASAGSIGEFYPVDEAGLQNEHQLFTQSDEEFANDLKLRSFEDVERAVYLH